MVIMEQHVVVRVRRLLPVVPSSPDDAVDAVRHVDELLCSLEGGLCFRLSDTALTSRSSDVMRVCRYCCTVSLMSPLQFPECNCGKPPYLVSVGR